MDKKFIDLSISIENGLKSDPPEMIPQIKYFGHDEGAEQMKQFFPGLDSAKDLPKGKGWAMEEISLTTHSGTHLDAPWHYHPESEGKRARTIDEIPLEWCMGNGIKLDFRHFEDGYQVTCKDLEKAFHEIGCEPGPGDIVLVNTGADKFWGKPEYLIKGCGFTKESTLWLTEKGVNVVGTDAWSWDIPLPFTAREFSKAGDSSIIWEAHFAGIQKEYCHIEKLTNLDKLPSSGFKFFCFPVKIKGASGAWIRAVALIE